MTNAAPTIPMLSKLFTHADENSDGRIDSRELQREMIGGARIPPIANQYAAHHLMTGFDADQDAGLSQNELSRAIGAVLRSFAGKYGPTGGEHLRSSAAAMFEAKDGNRDGALQSPELSHEGPFIDELHMPSWMASCVLFDALEVGHDGRRRGATLDELNALVDEVLATESALDQAQGATTSPTV